MESKTISIDDANQMLPLLRQIVRDIMTHWEKIVAKRTQLEAIESQTLPGPRSASPRDLVAVQRLKFELNYLIDKINHYIREVEELGCFVEEFKRGIVNFPSLHNGRKVFLCWQPEEEAVHHWHELDETYDDRITIRNVTEFLIPKPEVR